MTVEQRVELLAGDEVVREQHLPEGRVRRAHGLELKGDVELRLVDDAFIDQDLAEAPAARRLVIWRIRHHGRGHRMQCRGCVLTGMARRVVSDVTGGLWLPAGLAQGPPPVTRDIARRMPNREPRLNRYNT